MGLLRRVVLFARERQLGRKAVAAIARTVKAVAVGGSPAAAATNVQQEAGGETWLVFIGLYRKAIAAGIGALLGWLESKTGWQLTPFAPDVENLLVTLLITGYLTWRVPNKPAPAAP